MEKLKRKIVENKRILILYGVVLVFTLIVFCQFLSMHYATDTYNIINVGYKTYAINWSLTDGRIFMALIGLLAELVHMPITGYVIGLLVIALMISCSAVMCLKGVIESYKKPENKWMELVTLLISYLTIFNFMYLENLYFVECAVMAMSVLFYLFAAKNLVNKPNHYILKTIGWMFLAVISYQGTIGAFFAFLFVFTLLKNGKDYKQIGKDIGISILIRIINSRIQYAYRKNSRSYFPYDTK